MNRKSWTILLDFVYIFSLKLYFLSVLCLQSCLCVFVSFKITLRKYVYWKFEMQASVVVPLQSSHSGGGRFQETKNSSCFLKDLLGSLARFENTERQRQEGLPQAFEIQVKNVRLHSEGTRGFTEDSRTDWFGRHHPVSPCNAFIISHLSPLDA